MRCSRVQSELTRVCTTETKAVAVNVSVAVPEFVTVTVCGAEAWPRVIPPKLIDVGETEAAGWTPVPLSGTVCGLVGSVSAMDTEATRGPVAVGLKVTLILQLPPPTKPVPPIGQLVVRVKLLAFVPVTVMLVIRRLTVPRLVSTTVCGVLEVFTSWFPNASAPGTRPTPPTTVCVTVPDVLPEKLTSPA